IVGFKDSSYNTNVLQKAWADLSMAGGECQGKRQLGILMPPCPVVCCALRTKKLLRCHLDRSQESRERGILGEVERSREGLLRHADLGNSTQGLSRKKKPPPPVLREVQPSRIPPLNQGDLFPRLHRLICFSRPMATCTSW